MLQTFKLCHVIDSLHRCVDVAKLSQASASALAEISLIIDSIHPPTLPPGKVTKLEI